jgi:antitoxin (DNA-binding transcriptional repressor) of toxin-antitoxin stability system
MVTKRIDVHSTDLPSLLAEIADDTEILLVDQDKPVARLVPIAGQPKQRIAGLHPGSMRMSEDFDDPLPDSFWLGEE